MVSSEQARRALAKHGKVAKQDQWKVTFPIPEGLARFYEEVGPVDVAIESYGNPFFLPRLSKLWSMQAGYRWHGTTRRPLEGWDDDWLVVADQGGDPFILSRSSGAILFAEHGTGSWRPRPAFPDLNTMAACLALLGDVAASAGEGGTDEQDRILPEPRARAIAGLEGLLGSASEAESVLDRLGWG